MNKEDYELIKKLINSNTEHSLTLRDEAMSKLDKYINETVTYDIAQEYAEYCFFTSKKGMIPISINIFIKKPKWKYKSSRRISK
tara:strand:- start:59 stop:310 length:252 start_codon:yes stop_codon:yes gene_type:complete